MKDKMTPGPWLDWDTLEWRHEPRKLLESTANALVIGAAPELLKALAPFARFYEVAANSERGHGGRDTDVFYKLDDVEITLGDLRRAAEAVKKATGQS